MSGTAQAQLDLFPCKFDPADDSEIRRTVYSFYAEACKALTEDPRGKVEIYLPDAEWISSNSLNLLLTLIAAIRQRFVNPSIFVRAFSDETLRVLDQPSPEKITVKELKKALDRLRFLDKFLFLQIIHDNYSGVITTPSYGFFVNLLRKYSPNPELANMRKRPAPFGADRIIRKYSTTMMPLSRLIEGPSEMLELSNRIENIANILGHHAYFDKAEGCYDLQRARNVSELLMFEVVKNIYQHSIIGERIKDEIRGFASAQINKLPLIATSKPLKKTIARLKYPDMDFDKKEYDKRIRYLSIAIDDFGIGLISRVKPDVINRVKSSDAYFHEYDKNTIHEKQDDFFIRLAVTTDYSSKRRRSATDEQVDLGGRKVILHEKGYGLVYCLLFIGRRFGRMEIRSGAAKVQFLSTVQCYNALKEIGLTEALALFKKESKDLFEINPIDLEEDEQLFPGTQIIIEIPVDYRWVEKDSENEKLSEAEIKEIFERVVQHSEMS